MSYFRITSLIDSTLIRKQFFAAVSQCRSFGQSRFTNTGAFQTKLPTIERPVEHFNRAIRATDKAVAPDAKIKNVRNQVFELLVVI